MEYKIFRSLREKAKTLNREQLNVYLCLMLNSTLEDLVQRFIAIEFKDWKAQSYLVAVEIDELLLAVHMRDDFKLFEISDDEMYRVCENVYSHCSQELRKICNIKNETIKSDFEMIDCDDWMY